MYYQTIKTFIMGIDLTKKAPGSVDLSKGQTINLKKPTTESTGFDLSSIRLGMGWTSKTKFDLDASCVLLNTEGKMEKDSDLVYFGAQKHSSGKVWSLGDNTTGEGEGDDETIIAQLESLDSKYNKIVFFVNIYQGKSRGQRFSDLTESYCRIMDAKGKEIARFAISNNSDLNNKYSFIFGEAFRTSNGWEFKAIGEALETDQISGITEKFKATVKKGWFS